MAHTLSLNDVKAIVKTVVKNETKMKLRISSGSIFVQQAEDMEQGKHRYHFLVSTGGHGKLQWLAGMALNWISNVATGAAGAGTSGMGAVLSGGTTAVGKSAALHSLGGARRAGFVRDAQSIHKVAGLKNMLEALENHNMLCACGCVDASGSHAWGMYITMPSELGYYPKYKRILYRQDNQFKYRFKGSYLPKKGVLTMNGIDAVKLEKP